MWVQAVALVSHSLDQIIPEAAADQMAKIALSAEELDQLGKSVSGWLLEVPRPLTATLTLESEH